MRQLLPHVASLEPAAVACAEFALDVVEKYK